MSECLQAIVANMSNFIVIIIININDVIFTTTLNATHILVETVTRSMVFSGI